jgi:hypothetical protein
VAGKRQPVTTLSRKKQTIKAIEHEHECLLTKMQASHNSPIGKDPDQRAANPMCLHTTVYMDAFGHRNPMGMHAPIKFKWDETQLGQVSRISSCFTKM